MTGLSDRYLSEFDSVLGASVMPLIGTLRAIEIAEILTEICTMQEVSIALKIVLPGYQKSDRSDRLESRHVPPAL